MDVCKRRTGLRRIRKKKLRNLMRRQGRQSQLKHNTPLALCKTNSNSNPTHSASPLSSRLLCQEMQTSLICDLQISSATDSTYENTVLMNEEYDLLDDFTTILEDEYDIIDMSAENIPFS